MSIDAIYPPLHGMLPDIFMLPGFGHPYALRNRLTANLRPGLRLPDLLTLRPNSSEKIVPGELPKESNETSNLSRMNVRTQYQSARNILQTTKETSPANVSGVEQPNKAAIQPTALQNRPPVKIVNIEKRRATDKTGRGNNRQDSISEYVRRASMLRAPQPDARILKPAPEAPAMVGVIKNIIFHPVGFHSEQINSTTGREGSEANGSIPALISQIRTHTTNVSLIRKMLPEASLQNTLNRLKVNMVSSERLGGGASMLSESPPPPTYQPTEKTEAEQGYLNESSVIRRRTDEKSTDRGTPVNANSPMTETIIMQQFFGVNESEVRTTAEEVLLEIINAANSRI